MENPRAYTRWRRCNSGRRARHIECGDGRNKTEIISGGLSILCFVLLGTEVSVIILLVVCSLCTLVLLNVNDLSRSVFLFIFFPFYYSRNECRIRNPVTGLLCLHPSSPVSIVDMDGWIFWIP
jgi:hypothetical protein